MVCCSGLFCFGIGLNYSFLFVFFGYLKCSFTYYDFYIIVNLIIFLLYILLTNTVIFWVVFGQFWLVLMRYCKGVIQNIGDINSISIATPANGTMLILVVITIDSTVSYTRQTHYHINVPTDSIILPHNYIQKYAQEINKYTW